jgi:hypothetical protein
VPVTIDAIEAAMSPARLARFSRGLTTADRHHSLRLFVWNARLCEEFYLPCQIAEVTIRNAIHSTISRRFSAMWFDNGSFTAQLVAKYRQEVERIVGAQRAIRRSSFTEDHVVAELTFGFWVHLLTARYDDLLWQGGVFRSFPHVPKGMTRQEVHDGVDRLRNFRNKVAHHFAIFDQAPLVEYRNLLELVRMVCPETEWLITQLSNPARVISAKPRS